MLVDLEVFYLGHLKNFYTIQYNTIGPNPTILWGPREWRGPESLAVWGSWGGVLPLPPAKESAWGSAGSAVISPSEVRGETTAT